MKKTILITGSSHGIGAACAEAFAKDGYDVGINYCKSPEDAMEVAENAARQGPTRRFTARTSAKGKTANAC